jgi:transcription elongation factor
MKYGSDFYHIKIDDLVWWKIRIGYFYRTLSGRVTKINNNIATVKLNTQNGFGKNKYISINKLNIKTIEH